MRKISYLLSSFFLVTVLHASNTADNTIAYNYYYSYPNSVSQPGMRDDTNALYDSYLKKNQPNEDYWINKDSRNNYNNFNQNLKAEEYYPGNYGPTPYYEVSPYPQSQSQPGMGDDSNALYQSYLRAHHQGY